MFFQLLEKGQALTDTTQTFGQAALPLLPVLLPTLSCSPHPTSIHSYAPSDHSLNLHFLPSVPTFLCVLKGHCLPHYAVFSLHCYSWLIAVNSLKTGNLLSFNLYLQDLAPSCYAIKYVYCMDEGLGGWMDG